jgi:hypothetical protein
MKTPPTHHDDDDDVRPIYRMSFGDIGIVLIAAGCTLAFVLMMILPSPIAKYEKDKARAAEQARQEAIHKAVSSGEVSVGIAPARH